MHVRPSGSVLGVVSASSSIAPQARQSSHLSCLELLQLVIQEEGVVDNKGSA
jgi:hypothetical protein